MALAFVAEVQLKLRSFSSTVNPIVKTVQWNHIAVKNSAL